jgi:hypothetical protein
MDDKGVTMRMTTTTNPQSENLLLKALGSGIAGALALTAVHQTAAHTIPHAPRMDVIGRRAIARSAAALGATPPAGPRLQGAALAGDIVSNSLFYSLVALGSGRGRDVWRRGLVLGLAAGVGAAVLPPILGLGRQPGHRGLFTHMLTVLWYTLGGLAAAATLRACGRAEDAD